MTPEHGRRDGDPSSESPLAQLPTTRRAILTLLKREGPLDAAAVAAALSLTPAAVRQQLGRLEEDGLLTHHDDARSDPAGAAPPPLRVDVGGRGPLPQALRGSHHRAARLSGRARRPARSTISSNSAGVVAWPAPCPAPRTCPSTSKWPRSPSILDEDGYLADAERLDDGRWRITEHNCAILTVAHGFSQACTSELAFIRDALPGATVRRVAHLMDGAHVCAYEVSPPEPSSPQP